jgi:hypothetical protein
MTYTDKLAQSIDIKRSDSPIGTNYARSNFDLSHGFGRTEKSETKQQYQPFNIKDSKGSLSPERLAILRNSSV